MISREEVKRLKQIEGSKERQAAMRESFQHEQALLSEQFRIWIREQKEIRSQMDIAETLHMAPATISRIMKGEREISLPNAMALCHICWHKSLHEVLFEGPAISTLPRTLSVACGCLMSMERSDKARVERYWQSLSADPAEDRQSDSAVSEAYRAAIFERGGDLYLSEYDLCGVPNPPDFRTAVHRMRGAPVRKGPGKVSFVPKSFEQVMALAIEQDMTVDQLLGTDYADHTEISLFDSHKPIRAAAIRKFVRQALQLPKEKQEQLYAYVIRLFWEVDGASESRETVSN